MARGIQWSADPVQCSICNTDKGIDLTFASGNNNRLQRIRVHELNKAEQLHGVDISPNRSAESDEENVRSDRIAIDINRHCGWWI